MNNNNWHNQSYPDQGYPYLIPDNQGYPYPVPDDQGYFMPCNEGYPYPMHDDQSNPMQNVFIPASKVNVYTMFNKRKDKFLIVYADALSNLEGCQLETFLRLLLMADFNNRVCVRLSDLAKLFNISYRAAQERVSLLRHSNAFIGRVPFLFLNPFYGSKCSASVLEELRRQWFYLEDSQKNRKKK